MRMVICYVYLRVVRRLVRMCGGGVERRASAVVSNISDCAKTHKHIATAR